MPSSHVFNCLRGILVHENCCHSDQRYGYEPSFEQVANYRICNKVAKLNHLCALLKKTCSRLFIHKNKRFFLSKKKEIWNNSILHIVSEVGLWVISTKQSEKTKISRCRLKLLKKVNIVISHVHKVATEYTVVVTGKIEMNGTTLSSGQGMIVKPGTYCDTRAITESNLVIVKLPSLPGDKYKRTGLGLCTRCVGGGNLLSYFFDETGKHALENGSLICEDCGTRYIQCGKCNQVLSTGKLDDNRECSTCSPIKLIEIPVKRIPTYF